MNFIKHPATITVLALLAGLLAIIGFIRLIPEEKVESAPKVERYWGNPDSKVVVEYYGDFECPFCRSFWFDAELPLKREYSDKIKFQFKHFPLPIHARADNAAEAAEAAGAQGKFFEYAELLYNKQSATEVQKWNTATFVEYAKEVGVPDIDRFKRELESRYYRQAVEDSKKEGQERNVEGTPTVFVNGKKVDNPTYANIVAEINSALGITQTPTSTSTQ